MNALELGQRGQVSSTVKLVDGSEPTLTLDRPPTLDEASLVPGNRVGRYELVARLGAGGMGVVWLARDPKLDRAVAVKVLHELRHRDDACEARRRLRHEAIALACLSHPNVVSVYDLGLHEDRVFLTMAHIEGQTLLGWLGGAPGLERVLEVFEQAGAGLAAVHAAGFVHRDFKPANVMIDERGRVKVMDFGLARVCSLPGDSEPNPPDVALFLSAVTGRGVVMGTPSYMAPEQHLNTGVEAASDQYSFGIALFEALMGRRPFRASDFSKLAKEKLAAKIDFDGGRLSLCRRLRALLVRCLDPRPEHRFADMNEVCKELAELRRRGPGRRRRVAVAAAGVLLGCAGWAAVGPNPPVSCGDGQQQISQVWNAHARHQLRRSFEATELGYADDAARRVVRRLDAYADHWVEHRTSACEAQAGSEEGSDLRVSCLGHALTSMELTVDLLVNANSTTVRNADHPVNNLISLHHCEDLPALRAASLPPADAATRAAVEQIVASLESANAMRLAGRVVEGRATTVVALDEARALGHPRTVAQAHERLGRFDQDLGKPASAREHFTEAALLASSVGDHQTAAIAATKLVYLCSDASFGRSEALRWARHAEASLDRLPPDPLSRARLDAHLGVVHSAHAEYERARQLYERAYAAKRELLGPEHPEVTVLIENLALNQAERGRPERAVWTQRRAVRITRSALGPEHPDHAHTLMNLGYLLHESGRPTAAVHSYEQALRVYETAFGPHHLMVARASRGLSEAVAERGEFDSALALQRRASEIFVAKLGEHNREYGRTLAAEASTLAAQGKHDEALERYADALGVLESEPGPAHDSLALIRFDQARSFTAVGQLASAQRVLDEGVALLEAIHPPSHPHFGVHASSQEELSQARQPLRVEVEVEVEAPSLLGHELQVSSSTPR
ncbi:MAG: serine/threonine-protein kinase [Myxococcota bacterium]